MSTAALNKPYELHERRTCEDRRKPFGINRGDQAHHQRKKGLLFDIISSILVIFVGIAAYKFTGLYDGADSITWKIIMGSVISLSYVMVFRYALHSR
jgi:hypothetical protein